MQEVDPNFNYNQHHGVLASKQATQKPVLPIHTNTKHKLFKTLLAENSSFNNVTGPSWNIAVKV